MISVAGKRWVAGTAFALFASAGAPFVWRALYPGADDPKNVDYVLWKHGLNRNMNLDNAVSALAHDHWPARQVSGLSREGLEKKFGYVQNFESAPRLRYCYYVEAIRHPRASEEVSLRGSLLIVTLENGKAVDLLVCKGG